MARTIKWLGAVGLALGLVLGNRAAMAQETQARPAADPAVWGIYAQLAGSTRQAVDGYRLHWRWSQPGKELVEEYFAPANGKLMHTSTITPGPGPGTLHVAGSSLGGKEWNGTLQPDGSVVFAGTGMLKMSYKATIGSDGAYEIRGVKIQDGVVVSTRELASNSRYLPLEDSGTRVATATPADDAEPGKVVAAAPGQPAQPVETAASAVAVSAQGPAPATAPPIDPVQLKQRNRTIRDYYEHMINGPNGTPGVWLELTRSGSGISRYRRTEDGGENTFTFIRENGELAVNQAIQHFDDELGRIVRYVDGEPVVAAEIVRLPGAVFRMQTLPGFGVSEEEAASAYFDVAFVADRQEITTAKGEKRAYRWASESEAASVQASIQKRQAWLEAQRVAAAQEQARKESEQRAAAEAQRVALEQIMEQQRMYAAMNAQQEMLDAEADAEFEMERQEKAARWAQASAAAEQGLANSISRLDNTVASVEAQQAQYRAQQEAMRAQQEAASRAADAQRAREATERQYEIARQNEAQRQARQPPQAAAQQAVPDAGNGAGSAPAAAGKPLRFVMTISLRNKPGDTVNPTCYSNVITRPGPPGWGGSLPPGSGQLARETVARLKSQFIAACRASGRDITSEGDFGWVWNEFAGDDERVSGTGPRYAEDVAATL
jgi:hypothetical protein